MLAKSNGNCGSNERRRQIKFSERERKRERDGGKQTTHKEQI
jgi:hypothetical protein